MRGNHLIILTKEELCAKGALCIQNTSLSEASGRALCNGVVLKPLFDRCEERDGSAKQKHLGLIWITKMQRWERWESRIGEDRRARKIAPFHHDLALLFSNNSLGENHPFLA